MIDSKIIKQLREKTGAGIVDCKKAIEQSHNNLEKAIEILRKNGVLKAKQKQNEAISNEGLIEAYIHNQGKIGALIQVNCQTDFVARTKEFKDLVHSLLIQIASMNPKYIKIEDIPDDEIEKEKEIYRKQLEDIGKPEEIIEKIILGKLNKYYEEVCLLEQFYVKDESGKKRIKDLINEAIAKLGEKIEVTRFVRYSL